MLFEFDYFAMIAFNQNGLAQNFEIIKLLTSHAILITIRNQAE